MAAQIVRDRVLLGIENQSAPQIRTIMHVACPGNITTILRGVSNTYLFGFILKSLRSPQLTNSRTLNAEPIQPTQSLAYCGPCQLLRNGVVSRGRCNTGLQFICRSLKSQRFSWPLIETQSDLVQIRLRVVRQIGRLRQVLP